MKKVGNQNKCLRLATTIQWLHQKSKNLSVQVINYATFRIFVLLIWRNPRKKTQKLKELPNQRSLDFIDCILLSICSITCIYSSLNDLFSFWNLLAEPKCRPKSIMQLSFPQDPHEAFLKSSTKSLDVCRSESLAEKFCYSFSCEEKVCLGESIQAQASIVKRQKPKRLLWKDRNASC